MPNCNEIHAAKGLCKKHYARLRRRGDPFHERRRIEYWIDWLGYKRIRINGKYVKEHRHVMEQILGRPLNRTEIVHHKNGDKLDSRPENLELFASQADHMRFHRPDGWTGLEINKGFTHRWCGRCKEAKPIAEFSRCKAVKNGCQNRCKKCGHELYKQWYAHKLTHNER